LDSRGEYRDGLHDRRRDDRARCTPLHQVVQWDQIVLGQRASVSFPLSDRALRSLFEFMGGAVSSERPSATLIRQIAVEMVHAKVQGKRS